MSKTVGDLVAEIRVVGEYWEKSGYPFCRYKVGDEEVCFSPITGIGLRPREGPVILAEDLCAQDAVFVASCLGVVGDRIRDLKDLLDSGLDELVADVRAAARGSR